MWGGCESTEIPSSRVLATFTVVSLALLFVDVVKRSAGIVDLLFDLWEENTEHRFQIRSALSRFFRVLVVILSPS
jgi:hypothetical protein